MDYIFIFNKMKKKFKIGDFVIYKPLNIKCVIKLDRGEVIKDVHGYVVISDDGVCHFPLENELELDTKRMRDKKIKDILK